MNKKATFILWTSFIFLIRLTQAQQKAPPSIMQCLGNYEIFHSEILNEERTILIHVPDDYEHSTKKYPVLYILDAENTKRFIHSIEAISFYSAVQRENSI